MQSSRSGAPPYSREEGCTCAAREFTYIHWNEFGVCKGGGKSGSSETPTPFTPYPAGCPRIFKQNRTCSSADAPVALAAITTARIPSRLYTLKAPTAWPLPCAVFWGDIVVLVLCVCMRVHMYIVTHCPTPSTPTLHNFPQRTHPPPKCPACG